MLYTAYEFGYAAVAPARVAAGIGARFWRSPFNPLADCWLARTSAAALDVFEHATRRYPKPEWDIHETTVNGVTAAVSIEPVLRLPFCTLLRFRRDEDALKRAGAEDQPKVLIVAPLSGHYATLLRGTVLAMMPGHDVYITDWTDARLVPISAGRFDLNDYIDYLIAFLRHIGPRAHAMAVCQPGPALLSAAAVLAEDEDEARPATMTI
ncbi:MAG: polyhydroxyalkanoate depolymerase, partial [Parvularculaceae bacterium]|nr:polyhydroxyalkanoate depolymerase [Parvularculaceae bacterium]